MKIPSECPIQCFPLQRGECTLSWRLEPRSTSSSTLSLHRPAHPEGPHNESTLIPSFVVLPCLSVSAPHVSGMLLSQHLLLNCVYMHSNKEFRNTSLLARKKKAPQMWSWYYHRCLLSCCVMIQNHLLSYWQQRYNNAWSSRLWGPWRIKTWKALKKKKASHKCDQLKRTIDSQNMHKHLQLWTLQH